MPPTTPERANLGLSFSNLWNGARRAFAAEDKSESNQLDRTKRVQATALAAVGAKIVALLTAIVSIRLTLPYLGAERYGMWMTVVSAAAMLSFSDLGISSTVTTFIASTPDGVRDRTAQTYASSAFVLLISTTAILIACFTLAYPFVPWASLFNVHSSKAVAEAGPATTLFFLGTILCIPFSIVGRVQLGLQEGYKLHLWTATGSLATLLGIAVCAHFATGLAPFVVVSVFCPLLAMVGNWSTFFWKLEPRLRPRFSLFRIDVARLIASSGGIFLLQQIFSALTYGVDGLIIVRVLGPAAVAECSWRKDSSPWPFFRNFSRFPCGRLWRCASAWRPNLAAPQHSPCNRPDVGMNLTAGLLLTIFGKQVLVFGLPELSFLASRS